jgi:plastocyanin
MTKRNHRLASIGLGAAMLALAGCGGGGGATTAQSSAPPATTQPTGTTGAGGAAVTIRESEFKLDPANPKVKAGTVTFQAMNTGTVVHALEVEGKGLEVKTGNIQPGQSQTLRVKLDKPGTYEMYCPVDDHKGQGMKGEITVQ